MHADDNVDIFFKRTVPVTWYRKQMHVDIPVDLFSASQIDSGTQFLLREIGKASPTWERVLDLGCGYGPISLCLAATGRAAEVVATDRDALALAFTRRNAVRNKLKNVRCLPSVSYKDLAEEAFDAVVSNVPAKIGEQAHRMMLLGEGANLRGPREFWIVIVTPLEGRADKILESDLVTLHTKIRRREHTVYHYSVAPSAETTDDPFIRSKVQFDCQSIPYEIEAVHGLPEFDSFATLTEMAAQDALGAAKKTQLRRATVLNPGQGHLPVLLARAIPSLERIAIVSRDLLALRATETNLRANGFEGEIRVEHTARLDPPEMSEANDLTVLMLSDGEGFDIGLERSTRALAAPGKGCVVLGTKVSRVTRLEKALARLKVRKPRKTKLRGFGVLTYDAMG